jgi:sporulation protein YlmC with PRC-barrel domain
MISTAGCIRLQAAPAPPGIPLNEITTEQLIGYAVVSRDGTTIGPVHGVVISTKTGNTEYVVVFLEDLYNFGKGATHAPQDHYLPIPWAHVTLDTAHQQLVVDADATFVTEAPVLTTPPDTSVAEWDRAVQSYWTE